MARNAHAMTCGPEHRQELERLAGSRTESKQMIERARIILGCLAGKRVKEVAGICHTRPNTVIKWRQRFAQHGLAGLRDAPRSLRRRANRAGTVRRWPPRSTARCTPCGECCARRESACSG